MVDPVGVDHDPALGRLPEHLREAGHRQPSRSNDVGQHLPWPDRGQLVHVADEQQGRVLGDGPGERVHERHIDHRGLVHHEQIAVERVVLGSREAAMLGVDLQEAMDGLGLDPRLLGHALGGPARRGREQHPRRLSRRGCEGWSRGCWSCPRPDRRSSRDTDEDRTSRTASRCEADRVLPVLPSTHGRALSRSMAGQGGRALGAGDQPLSNHPLCRVQALEEDAGLAARPCR